MRKSRSLFITVAALVSAIGCHPSDILDVPSPPGEFTSQDAQGAPAALQAFAGARAALFDAIGAGTVGHGYPFDLVAQTGLLADEFSYRALVSSPTFGGADARFTAGTATGTDVNNDVVASDMITDLLTARSELLVARVSLQKYAAGTNPSAIGQAYALAGYAELLMAEDFCAGVPLSDALPQGGWSYGMPLTTDSLLTTAEAHFDSALAHEGGNDTVQGLASVGLGRVLLDRDSLTAAVAAVAQVPTGFVYNSQEEPTNTNNVGSGVNIWSGSLANYAFFTVSDREGGNGLDFISAADPRLMLDSALVETGDANEKEPDSVFDYPLKFGNPATGLIPLATGIEAQLITAEAALANNDPSWLVDLNAMRTGGCPDTATTNASCSFGTAQVPAQPSGLLPLTDPGTDTERVSLLFRERAFWLFGTGERLSDLRRLERQYHRSDNTVFPVGPYATGVAAGLQNVFQTYGTDVSFTLPTTSGVTTNPNYKGCTSSTATP